MAIRSALIFFHIGVFFASETSRGKRNVQVFDLPPGGSILFIDIIRE